MKKIKSVLVVCGGRSPEHEVTLKSTRYVLEHMHKETQAYDWGIDRENNRYALSWEDIKHNTCVNSSIGAPLAYLRRYQGRVEFCVENNPPIEIDIVFPMIHGTTGEDGIKDLYNFWACLVSVQTWWGQRCVCISYWQNRS